MLDTPDTPTIQTLVDRANAKHPRPDGRAWTAADTLKNVVLALTHLDGTRELVVVGLPGDRDVDLKRVEVAFAPGRGRAGDRDGLRAQPRPRQGLHRPLVRSSDRCSAKTSATGIRYLLDPRVVDGSGWITGANVDGQHVFGLVAGRDFSDDGTVEAAEVRAGDPAPDGSGPVELARGMEIGHVFQLGRKYAEALGLKVLDENGKLVTVTMGSYGIGVTRILAIIAELNNDDKGLIWPESVAPFDVHVVATGRDAVVFEVAETLAAALEAAGLDVLYDDRPKVSPGVKFGDAELIGVPKIVIVGRGAPTASSSSGTAARASAGRFPSPRWPRSSLAEFAFRRPFAGSEADDERLHAVVHAVGDEPGGDQEEDERPERKLAQRQERAVQPTRLLRVGRQCRDDHQNADDSQRNALGDVADHAERDRRIPDGTGWRLDVAGESLPRAPHDVIHADGDDAESDQDQQEDSARCREDLRGHRGVR